jgi:putative restriction endonuclease
MVSYQIIADTTNPYGLEKLKGTKILLPSEKHLWPDQNNLEWHRKKWFPEVVL